MSKAIAETTAEMKGLGLNDANKPISQSNSELYFDGYEPATPKPEERNNNLLFDISVLDMDIANSIIDSHVMRPLSIDDFNKGYMNLLGQLTKAGDVSESQFKDQFRFMKASGAGQYYIVVIEDVATSKIVASGSVLVERKFIRGCGAVGHIEDIVVDDTQRGKKYGKKIINQLTHIGKAAGCYKIILCCDEKNVGFYERCGYERKEVEMVHYF